MDNLTYCIDGKYRWIYEFSRLKERRALYRIWIVLAVLTVIAMIIGRFLPIVPQDLRPESFGETLTLWGSIFLFGALTTGLIYAAIVASTGRWYCMLYEMDEQGINCLRMQNGNRAADVFGVVQCLDAKHPTIEELEKDLDYSAEFSNVAKKESYIAFEGMSQLTIFRRKDLLLVGKGANDRIYAYPGDMDEIKKILKKYMRSGEKSE